MLKRKRIYLWPSWPLWFTGLSALALGAALAFALVSVRYAKVFEKERQERAILGGRIVLLTNALQSQSELVARLDVAVPTAPPETPPLPALEESSSRVAVAPVKRAAVRSEAPKVRPTPRPEISAPTVVTSTSSASKILPATPTEAIQASAVPAKKAEAVVQAIAAGSRIEGVTQEKAGIAQMYADAVEFKSGIRIRTGEKFPSGEKLLSVDPVLGRIVTDQRQILILDK